MRKILLLVFFASAISFAQKETVTVSMGNGYSKETYFKFSNGDIKSYDRDVWDIGFLRVSNYAYGIRLNEGNGLKVYEASNNISDWDNIDLSAENGTALHNNPKNWGQGAFDRGSASQGWGVYNGSDHHIYGTVIFLIKKSSTYYKFMVEKYFGAYHIKYAKWNGSSWEADQKAVIPNSTNNGHMLNFFNLESKSIVEASPAMANWDLLFNRYSDLIQTNSGESVPYTVSGVLHNPYAKTAQVEEETAGNWANTDNLTFSGEINIIGHDWKKLNSSYQYEIVPKRVYYVKAANKKIYRMYFTEFGGSSTGNITFTYEPQDMSTLDIEGNVKFAVYPNPVTNKEVTIVYDNAKSISERVLVEIYNFAGQKVHETSLNNSTGLFQKNIKLNNLKAGNYILRFTQGNIVKTKQLIVK